MSHQPNINEYFNKAYDAIENSLTEKKSEEEAAGKRKRKEAEKSKEAEGLSENLGELNDSDDNSLSTSSKKQRNDPPEVSHNADAGNTVIDSEDSESEQSEGEWEEVKSEGRIQFPDKSLQTLVENRFPTIQLTGRFNLLVKHKLPASPEKQMSKTMVTINKVLDQVNEEAREKFNWKGKPVLVPWQDEEIYSNRILAAFAYQEFHEKKEFRIKKAQAYLKEMVHKWGLLPRSATVKETGEATKYFQIQLAWIFEEKLVAPLDKLWYGMVEKAAESIEGASVRLSNTQSKDPITAIQFLNSAINISGTWDDLGHADCTQELKTMVQGVIGNQIEIGIASRKFDGGKYSDKTPQVMTVECDKKHVQRVQKELVSVFSKIESVSANPEGTSKKARIHKGIWTNWVAVPTFSSIASRSDVSKRAIYSQMEAQEKIYRANLSSYKVKGVRIENLDKTATDESHLSAEMLLQLENEIIEKGDSPIRHLIWDMTFKEMKRDLIQQRIPAEATEEEIKEKIKALKEEVTWKEVIEALNAKGIAVPHTSLPVPKPSKLSLRNKLLGLKSRRHVEENILVFESVTVTNEGELLLTYKSHCAEEAQAIGELLPLFIKHEMEVDPMFYCTSELLQTAQEGYYNPLVRTGYLGLMKNVFETGQGPNKKAALPEFCKDLTAEELVKVFKCPGFSLHPMFANLEEDDLASLANTIATSPKQKPLPEGGMTSLERMLKETKLIETSQGQEEEMSDMSGSSFDSSSSFNRFQIQERAKLLAKQMQMKEAIDKMVKKSETDKLSKAEIEMFCKIGEFTRKDVALLYPEKVNTIWPNDGNQMEIEEINEGVEEKDDDSSDVEEMLEERSYNSEDTEKRGGSPKKAAGSQNTGIQP
jgi:hypothetical protein